MLFWLRADRDPLADVAAFKAQGGHVLVGTPGRLSDVFERAEGTLDARRLEVLVLDEADRLLDAGYGKHLEALMRRLPKQRRTGAALPGAFPPSGRCRRRLSGAPPLSCPSARV